MAVMQLPNVNASSATYTRYTDHFEGAVEGWGDAEILVEVQRKAIGEAKAIVAQAANALSAAVLECDRASRLATRLRARYNIRDIILDIRIMSVNDAVLNGPAMRSRSSPAYRAIFQEGTAGDITESKIREQPEIAERVRDRLAAAEDFAGKAQIHADLSSALQKSFETRDALDAAEMAENKAGDAEIKARLDVRAATEKAYGILRAAFPGQRKLVESFFLKSRRKPAKAAEDEDTGDAES